MLLKKYWTDHVTIRNSGSAYYASHTATVPINGTVVMLDVLDVIPLCWPKSSDLSILRDRLGQRPCEFCEGLR